MTKPKEIVGELYFSEDGGIIGHLRVCGVHFELVGVRRSRVRADITGKHQHTERQGDLFDGHCELDPA
jgi:hypothetical protein